MLLSAQSPYSSRADVSRATQIALLIPVQRLVRDVVHAESHFPFPAYPAIPADQEIQKPQESWLTAVEGELAEVDGLAEADGLPPVESGIRAEAIRILKALNPQPIVPVIYAEESELIIQFTARNAPASVGIEIRNDGRGACYSHIDGRNRSAHYGTSRDIPDEFVLARLCSLSSLK